jgi:glutamyl-tRNA synthetase
MTVRTRFAPSPTGYLHVGGARTALFCYLFARRHGGQFVLRIEDTDLERSTPESVNAILEGMTWLGLDYDEGPFYQTDASSATTPSSTSCWTRGSPTAATARRSAWIVSATCRWRPRSSPATTAIAAAARSIRSQPHVVRFRNPVDGAVVVDDMIRGRIPFANAELDDLIMRRSDGSPTYNLTVVVDDADMGITHVIRGDDHVNNTPRQMNILSAWARSRRATRTCR